MYEVPGLAALLAHGLALALVRLASSGPRPGTWAHSCTQCVDTEHQSSSLILLSLVYHGHQVS